MFWRYPKIWTWSKGISGTWVLLKYPLLRKVKLDIRSRKSKRECSRTSSYQISNTLSRKIWQIIKWIAKWRRLTEHFTTASKWLISFRLFTKKGLCSITLPLTTSSSKEFRRWGSSTMSMLPRRAKKSCTLTSIRTRISCSYPKIYWKTMVFLHTRTT